MADASWITYGRWAGVAAVAGGYWYLQKRKPAARPTAIAQTVAAKAAPIKKDAKQKMKAVEASFSSGAETEKANVTKKKKAKRNKNKETTQTTAQVAAAPPPQVAEESDDEDSGEIDNKEFARQLSQAKSGLQMGSSSAASGPRQKSVKQSRANTNGFNTNDTYADADDSSSSARSNQGGVADMLEAPSAGPSSIRITAPSNAQPQKEKKAAKAPEPAETKKQRQNRKKREAEQEARAEAEQLRKVEEEKQRRTARIAEGRAAKDGSASMAKAAAASVWKGPESQSAAATNGHVQVLDTFEQPRAAPQQRGDYSSLPSEEEQMRQLQQEDSWQSVPSKKSKAKKASTTNDENVRPVEAAPAPVAQASGSTYSSARQRGLNKDEWRPQGGYEGASLPVEKEVVWQV